MHVHLIPLDDWCWQCPCGARAEHEYGTCRKCQARAAWRRRVMRPRRVRRTTHRAFRAVTK
jgi:hypothetical protein